MGSETREKKPVGVIGAGSFGTAVANLLAENQEVFLYSRRREVLDEILNKGQNAGQLTHPRVKPTNDPEELANRCTLIFPIVASKNFRETLQAFSPFLTPRHILIHGTKGLDVILPDGWKEGDPLLRKQVRTMTEVMLEETVVPRVGCLGGPNLAGEIARGLPAGTVIGSRFDEVIKLGREAIGSPRFRVYENHDLLGVELAGVLKNILAIGSGIVSGLELGENARALMITRGWGELMRVAEIFGSSKQAFLGISGIGDLIATCSSPLSRNFSLGFRISKGERVSDILASMDEVAEGYNTTRLAYGLVIQYDIHAPIISGMFQILFENASLKEAISGLMSNPLNIDVDYY